MAKRRVLQAPFLVTVSTVATVAALGAAGCGGDVRSDGSGNPIEEGDSGAEASGGAGTGGAATSAGGNRPGGSYGAGGTETGQGGTGVAGGLTGQGGTQPSFDPCPGAEPAHGTPCNVSPASSCSYPYCGFSTEARCMGGIWEHPVPTCNPPPPYQPCPTEGPVLGSTCYTDPAEVCEYGHCIVDWTSQARCFAGAWQHRYPSCWDPGRDAPWISVGDVDAGSAPGAGG